MRIKDFIYTMSPFADWVFFSVLGLMGMQFGGSDDSPIYKLFMVGVGGLVIVMTFWDILTKKLPTNRCFWIFLVGLPLVTTALYYLETGIQMLNMAELEVNILYMLCYSYTACCCGIYMADRGIEHFVKYFDIVTLVVTASLLVSIGATIGNGIAAATVGGQNYQIMSYMAAYSFCANLCMILWGDRYERFSMFNHKGWNYIAYFLLIIQLMACVISGGRGGFVLLAVGTGYMLLRSKKFGRMLTMGIFALLVAGAANSFTNTPLLETLANSSQRTFSYLDDNDTDLKHKAGSRGVLYTEAIQKIQDDNLLGRGIMRGIAEGYPHNIILEFGIQGGIPYIIFWMIIVGIFLKHAHWLINEDNSVILMPLILFPTVQLFFSGSYTSCPLFWLMLSYVFCRKEQLYYH